MKIRILRLMILAGVLLPALFACGHFFSTGSLAPAPLRYRPDGTFKIVTFGDIHWDQHNDKDVRTLALMDRIVEAEKPDLVIYTGDNCVSAEAGAIARGYRDLTSPAVRRGIPWAAVLGNHDGENGKNRAETYEIILQSTGTLTRRGPKGVHGFSNYVLPIHGSKIEHERTLLYFLDSNDYSPIKDLGFYDWIRPDQVQWYRQTAARYKARHHGRVLPAFAFFHIPLPEYDLFWEKGKRVGEKREDIGSPVVDSGLWAAMLEAGDIKAAFAGHAHVDDYIAGYHGIWLGFVRGIGYNTYPEEKDHFARGARVIELREGQRTFKTWLRIEDGKVIDETVCP